MGRFSFVLPPGVVPKLAGIPYCPEAAIARAKSRQGPHGGTEEIDHPSCPAASQIGTTEAGAGVGNQLTYVPGKLYLAGPYHGDPIIAVSITPAVAGPFDAGTVVVREALRLNPVTHVGEVDGSASDPIPHILKGIPLSLRDLHVNADRARLHAQPDQLRTVRGPIDDLGRGHRAGTPGRAPGRPLRPLPGRRLRIAGLQAQAPPQAQGRHPPRRLPRPARRLRPQKARRRQPQTPLAHLPRLRVHRTGSLQDHLHQGPVQRRRWLWIAVPQGLGLRARRGLDARCSTSRCGPRLPALLKPQPPRRRARPARPRRHRGGGEDRLGARPPAGDRRRAPPTPRSRARW